MPITGNNMHGSLAIPVRASLEARIDNALALVKTELYAAMTKHRSMASAHEGHSVIREELDKELWEHVCNDTGESLEARKEAIQVAAMGLRYALDITGL